MSDPTVDAFKKLPTAAISDALDRLGIAGQALGMAPLDVRFRLAGRAFTQSPTVPRSTAPVGR